MRRTNYEPITNVKYGFDVLTSVHSAHVQTRLLSYTLIDIGIEEGTRNIRVHHSIATGEKQEAIENVVRNALALKMHNNFSKTKTLRTRKETQQ